jgi:hypothetical protein
MADQVAYDYSDNSPRQQRSTGAQSAIAATTLSSALDRLVEANAQARNMSEQVIEIEQRILGSRPQSPKTNGDQRPVAVPNGFIGHADTLLAELNATLGYMQASVERIQRVV